MRLTGSENPESRRMAVPQARARRWHAPCALRHDRTRCRIGAAQLMAWPATFGKAHFVLLGDENQAIREARRASRRSARSSRRACGSIESWDLMTSYRLIAGDNGPCSRGLLDDEKCVGRIPSSRRELIRSSSECADDVDYAGTTARGGRGGAQTAAWRRSRTGRPSHGQARGHARRASHRHPGSQGGHTRSWGRVLLDLHPSPRASSSIQVIVPRAAAQLSGQDARAATASLHRDLARDAEGHAHRQRKAHEAAVKMFGSLTIL